MEKSHGGKHTPSVNVNQTNGSQTHVHEFLGSTKLAEEGDDRHNHRFAGVTSEIILDPDGKHRHVFLVNTDFFDHHHEVGGTTGTQIDVGDGKHVHFFKGNTTFDDGHCHVFEFATLILSPLLPAEDCPTA
ncbi:MAG: YmaF family protein [Pelotomaculum sp. PtaB.Bin104]|nr:MAG: YmaF family protein [Pelotomaculum sp. PtaB.Bin104]